MVYGLIGVMAEAIDEAVITFEKNVDLKLSALLLLGTAEFERQKADLLGAIDLAVRNYKNVMDMQIAAKHTAVQTYEREHPELSSRKCTQMMQQCSWTVSPRPRNHLARPVPFSATCFPD
jgi:hypothetical protein